MFNHLKALVNFLLGDLTPAQHYRNLALIGIALLIVIGIIAGWSVMFSIIAALLGGFAALLTYDWLNSQASGSNHLRQASERIRAGAQLFLLSLYKSIFWLGVVVTILIGLLLNWSTATGFLVGVLVSELIGYFVFNISLRTRSVTLNATTHNLLTATQLALSSGVISGLLVTTTALFGLGFYYTLLLASKTDAMFSILTGVASGAAAVSLLVSISAAIFAQSSIASCRNNASDNRADSVLSEPVNMIQAIAEHIADCTGVATDLFATTVAALVATIIINSQYATIDQLVSYPLLIMAIAIISTIGTLKGLQGLKPNIPPAQLLKRLLIASTLLTAILLLPVTWWIFDSTQLAEQADISISNVYQSAVIGLLLAFALNTVSSQQINSTQASCKYTVVAAYTLIILGGYFAYRLAGLIGLETSIMSLLSLSAIMAAVSTFSRLIDANQSESTEAGQLAQQQQLGAMAAAMSQTYRLAASTLVALMLITASGMLFSSDEGLSLVNIQGFLGIVLGIITTVWFCALLIKAISNVTKNSPSISSSHYAIGMLAKHCKRELLMPALIPVVVSILIGLMFGSKLVNGLAIGVGLAGLLIGLAAMAGGAAWMFLTGYFEYFWSATNQPTGWNEVDERLMSDLYRNAIASTLSPLIKIIAVITLLMTV
jgi:K(+)-stimulated pyrophosphate-energized sodium pump